ncbi:MAG: DUF1987 family protein [Bacteroidia bacterium]|nr:DUF1987 family protein [Bacteroidia bacterium]
MKSYINNPNPKTDFIIKLEYFNTSSARKLVEILFDLEEIIKKGKEIKVFWLYAKDDELIEGKGREIMSVVKIPFELRAI